MRLFYDRMGTALGLLGMLVWIVGVILLASAVTYVVVRLSPGDEDSKAKAGG